MVGQMRHLYILIIALSRFFDAFLQIIFQEISRNYSGSINPLRSSIRLQPNNPIIPLFSVVVTSFAGLYPINTPRYLVCTSCILLIVVPQILQIYREWEDLTVVLETSSVLLTILLALLKSFVWILNRRSMQPFIHFMLTDYWQSVDTVKTFKHLETYAIYAKKITKGYLLLICNSLLFFFSLPLIDIVITVAKGTADNSTKRFPFVALYPSACYSFPFYEITYISQMVATSICGLVILATDSLIATAVFHTCGHFKVLKQDLKDLDKSISKTFKDPATRVQTIKLQLADIVKHHQVVLWFCESMERNFNLMLLLQTLASSLIICLVGLQVSTTFTERSKLTKYFSYLIMALFQLLLFCFPGDTLIYQSSTISKVVYSVSWYKIPVPIKNEVCLLLLRGQKPSYITAGKFYVMHLENFSAVLSTALSYFMLLRSFN